MPDDVVNSEEEVTPAVGGETSAPDSGGTQDSAPPKIDKDKVFPALLSALSSQESGGNYSAKNGRTSASGKYQIMPANIRQWSKDLLGRELTPEEFRKNPKLQEQIARAKLNEYYEGALSLTSDPIEAAKLTANKWYTGKYTPSNDGTRPAKNEPSPEEYRSQFTQRLGQSLGVPIDGMTSAIDSTEQPRKTRTAPPLMTAPVVNQKPFTLDDVFNPPPPQQPDTSNDATAGSSGAVGAVTPPLPTSQKASAPTSTVATPEQMARWKQISDRQDEIDKQKAAPPPTTATQSTTDAGIDTQQLAYDYVSGQGGFDVQAPVKFTGDSEAPTFHPMLPTSVSDATSQQKALPKGGVAYSDEIAQANAAKTGIPIQGKLGVYRPYVMPDGTKGSTLSTPATEAKIEELRQDRVKKKQNIELKALGNMPDQFGALYDLASKSQIMKDVVGTALQAGDTQLGGLPSAIFPKTMEYLREQTTNPDPAIASVQKIVGTTVGMGASIVAGAFKASGIVAESLLGRLATKGAENLVLSQPVRMAATLGIESIPREAVKSATGQQTVGEGLEHVGESALTGAVLGVGGEVGSKASEVMNFGRAGTVATKAAFGGLSMGVADVAQGRAPDPQSVITGVLMEGYGGLKEGAARDIKTIMGKLDVGDVIDHTVASVGDALGDTPAKGFAVGRADVVDAIKIAHKEGNNAFAPLMERATEILHERFGEGIDKDLFKDNVSLGIIDRSNNGGTRVAEDQTIKEPVKDSNPLADTEHVAAGGKYTSDADIIERPNKTGKNRGKIQRGVIATDISAEQVEAITNRKPIKEGDGFFIPEKYVKRPTTEEPNNENGDRASTEKTVEANSPKVEVQQEPVQEVSSRETEATPVVDKQVEVTQDQPVVAQVTENEKAQADSPAMASKNESSLQAESQAETLPEGNPIQPAVGSDVERVGSPAQITTTESELGKRAEEQSVAPFNDIAQETPTPPTIEPPPARVADQEFQAKVIDALPVNGRSDVKDIVDYAIQHRLPTRDEAGNKLGWKAQLKVINDDAIAKATRPITDDVGVARGEETAPIRTPMGTSGTLNSEIFPGASQVFNYAKKILTANEEIHGVDVDVAKEVLPKIHGVVDWLRQVSDGVQRGVAPQTRRTIIDPNSIETKDLQGASFQYKGNDYRVKVEKQEDGSHKEAFYKSVDGKNRRVIAPSDALRAELTDAAKQAYAKNAGISAHRTALLMRDVNATSKRYIGIQAHEAEALRNIFSNRSAADNTRFISDIMMDRPMTDPTELSAATAIRKIFREQGERVMAAAMLAGKDIHFDLRDTFFSLLWEKKSFGDLGTVMNGKKPFEGTKYFLNKKVFQDISEGIAKGLVPKYTNPFDFAMHYVAETEKLVMGLTATKSLKDMGYVRTIRSARNAPAGWEKVEALSKYGRNEEGSLVKSGDVYAPSGAAQILNNFYSSGFEGPVGKPLYQGWMLLNNHLNQLQLSLSGFHATFVTMESVMSRVSLGLTEGAYGVLHAKPEFAIRGAKTIFKAAAAPLGTQLGRDVRTEWFKPGSTGNSMATIIADILTGGGHQGEMSKDFQAGKSKIITGEGVVKNIGKTILDPAKRAAKDIKDSHYIAATLGTALDYVELPTRVILEKYVPHMKFMAATELAKFELDRFYSKNNGRDPTREEMRGLGEKVVDVIDDRFGELAYDNLFWNKKFKQTAMGLQRSVGWNYGVLRTILGGSYDYVMNTARLGGKVVEKVSGGKYTQEKSPEFTHRMSYLLAFPTIAATIGSIINTLTTGEPPQDLKDMFFPRTGGTDEHGNASRISVPSYANDAFNLIGDALSLRKGPQPAHPFKTVGHKFAPGITFLEDILTNKDYYEREIIPNEVSTFSLKGMAAIGTHAAKQFTPFSITQLNKSIDEGAGSFSPLAFVGVKPAPASINRSEMQEFLSEKSSENASGKGRSAESVEQKMVSYKIENLFRQGKSVEANALGKQKMQEGVISPQHLADAYRDAHESVRSAQLKHASQEDAMTAYFDIATEDERKKLGTDITRKVLSTDIYDLTPARATQFLNKIEEAQINGKTKYMNERALNNFTGALKRYVGLYSNKNLPKMNFPAIRQR